MNSQSLVAAGLAVLLVAAGAGAALTGTEQSFATDDEEEVTGPRDVDVDATFDNGSVTMTVTSNDTGVENISVLVEDERVGTTDADGTVTFETNETDDLEVELEKGEFEGKLKYQIVDGSLVIVEEEYEYAEIEDDEDEEDEDEADEVEDADEDDEEEEDDEEDEDDDETEDDDEETETEADTED